MGVFLGRCWIIFQIVYGELKEATYFFRTSRTSGISPLFYIPYLKYYLLHKDSMFIFYIFSNFFYFVIFLLNLKIPFFIKSLRLCCTCTYIETFSESDWRKVTQGEAKKSEGKKRRPHSSFLRPKSIWRVRRVFRNPELNINKLTSILLRN